MKVNRLNVVLGSILFFLFQNASVRADALYSLRARPFAIMTSTYGLEAFVTFDSGFFIGPTAHFFSGDNPDRQTALKNSELGIKFGKLFSNDHPNQGWFLLGNVNYNISKFQRFYSATGETFSADLSNFSESFFAGYQWDTYLIGNHLDFRLGLGLAYLGNVTQTFETANNNKLTLGLTNEFDPSLEITLGYTF